MKYIIMVEILHIYSTSQLWYEQASVFLPIFLPIPYSF